MRRNFFIASLCAALLAAGCTTYQGIGPQAHQTQHEGPAASRKLNLSPELEQEILRISPDHVSEEDVHEFLSHAPAPRIINIRGGIYPVYLAMSSFSEFLVGMGYPEASIKNPKDGAYSLSCYQDHVEIAGMVAWYYEQEGMRPMMVGHSQGGMQTIKVLHRLAAGGKLHVWNPLTHETEKRTTIIDPLTGQSCPASSVIVSYATAVGAGGFTRALPNQWDMMFDLHKIPDSVEEFTGFSKGSDPLGGDLLGYEPANIYKPIGKEAKVRNVRLPASYNHALIPKTKHLLESQLTIDWINTYTPTNRPALDVKLDTNSENILWAADVWHSIKRHWVMELQRLIRAKQAQAHDH